MKSGFEMFFVGLLRIMNDAIFFFDHLVFTKKNLQGSQDGYIYLYIIGDKGYPLLVLTHDPS
jgi:hypothetical protein